jgi:hypothetical protein
MKLVCLLHIPRKRVPQNPYIPTHWASTHTPPGLPQTSANEGALGLQTGLHTRQSTPAFPASPRRRMRERKWPVQGLRKRNAKPSVGQTSTDSEFLNVKGKNKLQRRSVLLSHWNHFLSSPTMGEDQSFPRALAYRACTSCTTGCKDPVPSASVVAPLLPAILLLSPSLPLFS